MDCGPTWVTKGIKGGVESDEQGEFWRCILIEVDTRLRVGRGIGKTETDASIELLQQLKRRGHPEAPPPLVSDGWGGHREALIEVYGEVPDYSGRGRPPSLKQPSEDWLNTVVPAPQPGGTGGQPGIAVFDPAISKVGQLEPGGIGLPDEKLTWTITVTNTGTVAGTDIAITDTMPAELRLDSAATERGTYSINGSTVTFTIPTLNPGESVQMWVYTTVISSPSDGAITNVANLTSGSVTDSATGVVNVVTSLPATGYPTSDSRAPRSYTGVWLALAGLLVIALGGWRLRRARG
jgi:uncharacterized repeat protein (TIGR01451 family)